MSQPYVNPSHLYNKDYFVGNKFCFKNTEGFSLTIKVYVLGKTLALIYVLSKVCSNAPHWHHSITMWHLPFPTIFFKINLSQLKVNGA